MLDESVYNVLFQIFGYPVYYSPLLAGYWGDYYPNIRYVILSLCCLQLLGSIVGYVSIERKSHKRLPYSQPVEETTLYTKPHYMVSIVTSVAIAKILCLYTYVSHATCVFILLSGCFKLSIAYSNYQVYKQETVNNTVCLGTTLVFVVLGTILGNVQVQLYYALSLFVVTDLLYYISTVLYIYRRYTYEYTFYKEDKRIEFSGLLLMVVQSLMFYIAYGYGYNNNNITTAVLYSIGSGIDTVLYSIYLLYNIL